MGKHPEAWVALELRYARAILATDPGVAAARFGDALSADLARWPFDRAQGLSNREIGQKLFVSPRTVSTHLYRIYPKLGISARSQLTAALSETP